MSKPFTIKLDPADVFQTLDALESRAEAYELTANFLEGEFDSEDPIIPEECRDVEEAEGIARHFRDIIEKIKAQIEQD